MIIALRERVQGLKWSEQPDIELPKIFNGHAKRLQDFFHRLDSRIEEGVKSSQEVFQDLAKCFLEELNAFCKEKEFQQFLGISVRVEKESVSAFTGMKSGNFKEIVCHDVDGNEVTWKFYTNDDSMCELPSIVDSRDFEKVAQMYAEIAQGLNAWLNILSIYLLLLYDKVQESTTSYTDGTGAIRAEAMQFDFDTDKNVYIACIHFPNSVSAANYYGHKVGDIWLQEFFETFKPNRDEEFIFRDGIRAYILLDVKDVANWKQKLREYIEDRLKKWKSAEIMVPKLDPHSIADTNTKSRLLAYLNRPDVMRKMLNAGTGANNLRYEGAYFRVTRGAEVIEDKIGLGMLKKNERYLTDEYTIKYVSGRVCNLNLNDGELLGVSGDNFFRAGDCPYKVALVEIKALTGKNPAIDNEKMVAMFHTYLTETDEGEITYHELTPPDAPRKAVPEEEASETPFTFGEMLFRRTTESLGKLASRNDTDFYEQWCELAEEYLVQVRSHINNAEKGAVEDIRIRHESEMPPELIEVGDNDLLAHADTENGHGITVNADVRREGAKPIYRSKYGKSYFWPVHQEGADTYYLELTFRDTALDFLAASQRRSDDAGYGFASVRSAFADTFSRCNRTVDVFTYSLNQLDKLKSMQARQFYDKCGLLRKDYVASRYFGEPSSPPGSEKAVIDRLGSGEISTVVSVSSDVIGFGAYAALGRAVGDEVKYALAAIIKKQEDRFNRQNTPENKRVSVGISSGEELHICGENVSKREMEQFIVELNHEIKRELSRNLRKVAPSEIIDHYLKIFSYSVEEVGRIKKGILGRDASEQDSYEKEIAELDAFIDYFKKGPIRELIDKYRKELEVRGASGRLVTELDMYWRFFSYSKIPDIQRETGKMVDMFVEFMKKCEKELGEKKDVSAYGERLPLIDVVKLPKIHLKSLPKGKGIISAPFDVIPEEIDDKHPGIPVARVNNWFWRASAVMITKNGEEGSYALDEMDTDILPDVIFTETDEQSEINGLQKEEASRAALQGHRESMRKHLEEPVLWVIPVK